MTTAVATRSSRDVEVEHRPVEGREVSADEGMTWIARSS